MKCVFYRMCYLNETVCTLLRQAFSHMWLSNLFQQTHTLPKAYSVTWKNQPYRKFIIRKFKRVIFLWSCNILMTFLTLVAFVRDDPRTQKAMSKGRLKTSSCDSNLWKSTTILNKTTWVYIRWNLAMSMKKIRLWSYEAPGIIWSNYHSLL